LLHHKNIKRAHIFKETHVFKNVGKFIVAHFDEEEEEKLAASIFWYEVA
jgi:hypothetical protein